MRVGSGLPRHRVGAPRESPGHLWRVGSQPQIRRHAGRAALAGPAQLRLLGRELVVESTATPGYVFPLISGAAGPVMPELKGGAAQRLLDREDVDRDAYPR